MEHFGQKIAHGKYGFELNRENYAPLVNLKVKDTDVSKEIKINQYAFNNESCTMYTQDWLDYYRSLALLNLDVNLNFFSSLSDNDFNDELDKFLSEHDEFEKVENLDHYDGVSGYYILVYDQYKQIYIGNTDNLKKRIRIHWTSVVPIERSLFPMYNVETSKISVRSFRALDNTRIYIAKDFQTYIKEDYYINKIAPTYILNRIQGGRIEKNSKVSILESAKIDPTSHLELPEPPNSHPDLEMYEKIRANYEIEKAMKQAHYEDVMRSRENNALKKI